MLKKTIKYKDFDNNEREEDLYFNLTKSELTEWQLSKDGGLDAVLNKMIQEKDAKNIILQVKDVILRAYGEKSLDGKHFMKSPEISNAFYCSEAYNQLFMEIVASPESAMAFINGILPEDVRKSIEENAKVAAQINAQD